MLDISHGVDFFTLVYNQGLIMHMAEMNKENQQMKDEYQGLKRVNEVNGITNQIIAICCKLCFSLIQINALHLLIVKVTWYVSK